MNKRIIYATVKAISTRIKLQTLSTKSKGLRGKLAGLFETSRRAYSIPLCAILLTILAIGPLAFTSLARTDTYTVGALEIRIVDGQSDYAPHPGVRITIPDGYRLLGGGARVNYSGEGNLLTGIWPDVNGQAWVATSKDHLRYSPATITAHAIFARMADGSPIGDDDYIVVSSDSVPASHPSTEAVLPDGFVLVGGGARDNWSGEGNLLTASYPDGNRWVAMGKDQIRQSTATVTAFAIGVRASFLAAYGLQVQQRQVTSGTPAQHPTVSCSLDYGYRILSGGAAAAYAFEGQLLTTSVPLDRHTWFAASKDHLRTDFGTVTAYCIGISF